VKVKKKPIVDDSVISIVKPSEPEKKADSSSSESPKKKPEETTKVPDEVIEKPKKKPEDKKESEGFSWEKELEGIGLAEDRIKKIASIFSDNELQLADISDFDHELLQSMGLTVAKERLAILKWAKNK